MSRWYIQRNDGGATQTVAVGESLELHDEWMGDCYVTVTVHSPEPVDFKLGDFIYYREEIFSIIDDPNIIKKARSGSYGEGFTYENIKFYSAAARTKHIAFNDYVLPDPNAPANKIPYSSMSTFSFFAASLEDLADRIQANLDRMEPDIWHVYTPMKARSLQRGISASDWAEYYDGEGLTTTGKTDIAVTADNLSCWDALKLSFTAFDASYYIQGNDIIIGAPAIAADHDFKYGKGLGLYEIERATDDNQQVITKLYAYGSERNIPYGYYANKGRTMRFPILWKSQREVIVGNPQLILWVNKTWNEIGKVFNDSYELTISCNGLTAVFGATHDHLNGYDEETGPLVPDQDYLQLWSLTSHADALALYNSVAAGGYVQVVSGVNINKMPSEYIVTPQTYDYDAALSVNRLMLPGFPDTSLYDWVLANGGLHPAGSETGAVIWGKWSFYASTDKKDPWIMSPKIKEEGVREGTATFDESSGHEICPTIEGTGLDIVSWAKQIDDNGYLGDDPKEEEKLFGFMPDGDPDDIDWNDTDGEEVTISMKTGACVGREFKMRKAKRNEDTGLWELTLERYYDSSIGRYFPYNANASGNATLYQVMGTGNWHGTKQGDKYVALGIKLPDAYVEIASKKLLEAALDHLYEVDHHRHTYVPKVDEIYMKRQDDFTKSEYEEGDPGIETYGTVSIHDTLHAGMMLKMNDTDLKLKNYTPFIDVLTIKEDGNNGIPTYDIVLREEKELTLQDRIQSQIEGGVNAMVNVSGGKGVSTADIMSAISDKFLSKTEEDETEFLIRFLGGIVFDKFVNSDEFIKGNWVAVTDPDTGEPVLDPDTGEQMYQNDGIGAGLTKDGSVWTLEVDEVVARLLVRARRIIAEQAQIGKVTNQTVFKMGLRALGDILLGNYIEGRDPDEQDGGKLTPYGYADIKELFTRLKAVIGNGLITEETEPGVFVREPSLTVNGDTAFSDWLSSFNFESGFPFGKGWAIKSFQYTNPAGQTETKWSLEIDNVTVRNILRVYEMIISQLMGENDNYIFAAMMEVDHYDPITGKVWLSTNGGKTYNSFRVGDCIMVQRYQPGNTAASGGDGYITKMYELVISEVGTGGDGDPTDENGDRLDWVKFVNFTTPMVNDDPTPPEDYHGTYYTEEELDALRAQIKQQHPAWDKNQVEAYLQSLLMLPEQLIAKGDTFCRVDNLYDPERKGVVQINSVGPDAPYMDVRYGTKTDPNNSLKVRVGNLNGIRSELFGGWLQGYGVYDINNYSVGTFVNKQTGERTESRVAISDKEMQINYKETLYDVSDEDNKVTNGFFQNEMEGWDLCHTNGTVLTQSEITQQNKKECVGLEVGDTPLLINGSILQFSQMVDYAKLSEYDGIQVLHLHNMGVYQKFSLMKANETHEEDATGGVGTQPDFEKESYLYWKEQQPTWTDTQIFAKIDEWVAINNQRIDTLTSTDDVADKLYCGVRMLPLTEGDLIIKFIPTSGSPMTITKHVNAALEWKMIESQDHSASGEVWQYDPEHDPNGRFVVSYTGECYIRFIALTNDPISDAKAEYQSWFNINSRRIDLHAERTMEGKTEAADLWIQYNAIVSRVTTDEANEKKHMKDLLGITINSDGSYTFPQDWVPVDGKYDFSSWRIQTAGRIDDIVSKWDEDGNLKGYSQHTQTADFMRDVIAATSSHNNWGVDAQILLTLFNKIFNFWYYDKRLWSENTPFIISDDKTELGDLWNDFKDQYAVVVTECESILDDDLVKGSSAMTALNTALTTLKNKYTNVLYPRMEALLALNAPITTKFHRTEIDNVHRALCEVQGYTSDWYKPYLTDFCNKLSAISVVADTNLNENVKKVTEDFEDFQEDLDKAISDRYPGKDFLSWASDTAVSSLKIKAVLDANGGVTAQSTAAQTADLIFQEIYGASSTFGNYKSSVEQTMSSISSSVQRYEKESINLANPDKWERKDVQPATNGTYDDVTTETPNGIKRDSTTRILYKDLVPVTKDAAVTLNDGYDVYFVYFNKNGRVCSTTNSGWKSVTKDSGTVVESNISIKPTSGSLPSEITYVGIVIRKHDNTAITQDAIKDTGLLLIDSKLASGSYVNQTANGITQVITDNKSDADSMISKILGIGTDANGRYIIPTGWDDDEYNYATWRFDTQTSLDSITAKWDSQGRLIGYSTTQQTSDMISSSVVSLNQKTTVLTDTSLWEQGSTQNETAGNTYEQAKKDSDTRIRMKSPIYVSADTEIQIGDGYQVGILCFGYDNRISSNTWKGWYSNGSDHLKLKNTISASTHYIVIIIRRSNNTAITPSNVTGSGIKVVNSEVATYSEVKQTTDAISTTVASNKDAADAAFRNINNEITNTIKPGIKAAQDAADAAQDGVDTINATSIMQDKDRIAALAANFNADGTVNSASGIVIEDNFSTLFANEVTTEGIAHTADLTVYVQKDANDNIVSGIKMSADQLNFNAKDIIWNLGKQWTVLNKNNQTILYLDANGNLSIGGQLTATQTNLNVTQANVGSLLVFDNASQLKWKSNASTGSKVLTMLTLDANNQYVVGEGLTSAQTSGDYARSDDSNYRLYLRGTKIIFQTGYGNSGSAAYGEKATLTSDGVLEINAIKIGDTYIGHDSNNGALKVYKISNGSEVAGNLYTKGWLSAYGVGSTSSGGGTDLNAVLAHINTHYNGTTFSPGDNTVLTYINGSWTAQAISGYVKTGGTQTITGAKTFTKAITVNGGSKFDYIGLGGDPNSSYKLNVTGTSYFSGKIYLRVNSSTTVNMEGYTTPGGNYLNVNATGICVNGSVISSDIRKKNIVSYIDDLEIGNIADAPIFNFTWKDESYGKGVHVGTSAQYWQRVLPNTTIDMGEYGLTLDYNAISVVSSVITARKVVEQEKEIQALKDEVAELKELVKQLMAK